MKRATETKTSAKQAIRREFPRQGLVRLNQILAPQGPLPISKSSWWAGVKSGRYPPAIKLGPRTTCFDARRVRALFETTSEE